MASGSLAAVPDTFLSPSTTISSLYKQETNPIVSVFYVDHLIYAYIHIHDASDGVAYELKVLKPVVVLLAGHEGDVEVTQIVIHRPAPAVTAS